MALLSPQTRFITRRAKERTRFIASLHARLMSAVGPQLIVAALAGNDLISQGAGSN
jgi:hypothetical protein